MYERSAIVLEKYFNKVFGFNESNNLKNLYNSYKTIIEETCKYQEIIEEEEKVIEQFDQIANEIRSIQQEQKKLYKSNIKLEEDRNKLFDDLDEEPALLEKKLEKIGQTILSNNERLEELKNGFINSLKEFNERQKERNKCSKTRRLEESAHIQLIEEVRKELQEIDVSKIKELKQFATSETLDDMKKEIAEIMINNGRDEKVKFNEDVVEKSVNARTQIAQKEAEAYISVYDKTRRLLNEIENEDIKLDKYQKTLRDVSVKLEFLKAEKEYIVSFLDNERMTAINGLKAHKVMMTEACEKFELDIEQFGNLYQLVLREIAGKSTKKAYNELYNKEYLKNIEEKEKNFEEAINNIKLKAGTIINSNYWRIDGIKNIYEVFQDEITTKFGKNLSEYQLEELEDEIEEDDSSAGQRFFGERVSRHRRNRQLICGIDKRDENGIYKRPAEVIRLVDKDRFISVELQIFWKESIRIADNIPVGHKRLYQNAPKGIQHDDDQKDEEKIIDDRQRNVERGLFHFHRFARQSGRSLFKNSIHNQ